MDNPVLTTEFEIEILERMTYAQLEKFTNDLEETIKDLKEMKEQAVLCLMDEKAVEYQGYERNAKANRDTMLVVMMAKEGDVCEHTEIETIWLN